MYDYNQLYGSELVNQIQDVDITQLKLRYTPRTGHYDDHFDDGALMVPDGKDGFKRIELKNASNMGKYDVFIDEFRE